MKLASLEDLFIEELKDLYHALKINFSKRVPKMAKAATSRQLKNGFERHLKQTEGHVARLEQIFQELDASPKRKKCKAMEGLIEEGAEVVKEDAEPEVKDAGADRRRQAQTEHYKIAGYGCVRSIFRS